MPLPKLTGQSLGKMKLISTPLYNRQLKKGADALQTYYLITQDF